MAWQVSKFVWEHSQHRASYKIMLLALSDFANARTGECWPAVDTLARYCGVKRRRALQVLAELERDGSIIRTQRSGRPTLYHIAGYAQGTDIAPVQSAAPVQSGDERGAIPGQGVQSLTKKGLKIAPELKEPKERTNGIQNAVVLDSRRASWIDWCSAAFPGTVVTMPAHPVRDMRVMAVHDLGRNSELWDMEATGAACQQWIEGSDVLQRIMREERVKISVTINS